MAPILSAFPFTTDQGFVVIFAFIALAGVTIAMTAMVTNLIAKVYHLRSAANVKQQMIAAGYSADDIIRVLSHSGSGDPMQGPPVASEVVVNRDGDWVTALALNYDGDRYYVHYVGADMSSNEWVPTDRIRFRTENAREFASQWPDNAHFAQNGMFPKPAPLETEL